MKTNRLWTVLLGLLLLLPNLLWARGLSFKEEMHGYAYYQSEFRTADVYLSITIKDIDAWRSNQSYAAQVTGTLVMDRVPNQSITGTLQVLAPAPGDDGRLLTYRFTSGSLQFTGMKHVKDNGGMDLIDDMTTLHGKFQALGQTPPSAQDLLYKAAWTSELHFEWWKPANVLSFAASFSTINTPWYQDLTVKALFVTTVMGDLAKEYFPWLFIL